MGLPYQYQFDSHYMHNSAMASLQAIVPLKSSLPASKKSSPPIEEKQNASPGLKLRGRPWEGSAGGIGADEEASVFHSKTLATGSDPGEKMLRKLGAT